MSEDAAPPQRMIAAVSATGTWCWQLSQSSQTQHATRRISPSVAALPWSLLAMPRGWRGDADGVQHR
jgi:hypothetical protein